MPFHLPLPLHLHENKTRIFLVPYLISGGPDNHFHWALWTEEPGSTHAGHSFDVIIPQQYTNLPPVPRWAYQLNRPGSFLNCPRMLGRVLIGKVPKGMDGGDLARILAAVDVPAVDETCRDWTREALRALQAGGVLGEFDVEELLSVATGLGTEWLRVLRERSKAGLEKVHHKVAFVECGRFP